MIDSIYVAMTGLNGHEQGLKVISNNVANMNTSGFKGSQVEFEDIYLANAGMGTESDPSASGGGVTTLPNSVSFKAGTLQQTGRDLDLALDGPAFFVLHDQDGKDLYTKNGQFEFNSDGVLVTSDRGYLVMGKSGGSGLSPIQLGDLKTSKPTPTTHIVIDGNLSSTGTDASIASVKVTDAAGGSHDLAIAFKSGANGVWNATVTEAGATVATGSVTVTGTGPDPTANGFTISLHAANGANTNINVSLASSLTAYSTGTSSTISVKTVDGYGLGQISKLSFDAKGILNVAYTNGQNMTGSQLALANFSSTDDLKQVGGTLFRYQGSSAVDLTTAGNGTALDGGTLELSNVDMTDQFSTLILIQRGYQASSQVLSTASEMIQDLYDMRSRK